MDVQFKPTDKQLESMTARSQTIRLEQANLVEQVDRIAVYTEPWERLSPAAKEYLKRNTKAVIEAIEQENLSIHPKESGAGAAG